MKIGYTGLDLAEGKVKYNDPRLKALADKDKPKKVTPYFVEFLPEEFIQVEAIVVPRESILDVLILDMDKAEARRAKAESEAEKAVLAKCMEHLEAETPLCDVEFSDAEMLILKNQPFVSLKAVAAVNSSDPVDTIIAQALDKAGYMFFYTSGPTESHAWLTPKGSTAVQCAGKIHSDLERGFIRADVVPFDTYLANHSFSACKQNGAARLENRDYIVQPGEVLEIRFSV